MMKRALLIVLLALGGCQPETPEDTGPPDLSGYDPEAATRAQQICETDGGNWAKGGLARRLCLLHADARRERTLHVGDPV